MRKILVRSPFRCSLFGGGTDYPGWYNKHGGMVVGFAVNQYSYVLLRKLPGFFDYRNRLVYSAIETTQTLDEIEHRLIKATLERECVDFGVELIHYADLPGKSGLGSSSAFAVSMVHAVNALRGSYISKKQIADTAIDIEQKILQETVGCQDQYWAAFGGIRKITFSRNNLITPSPILVSQDFEQEIQNSFFLCYTGIERYSTQVASSYLLDFDKIYDKQKKIQELADLGLQAFYDYDIVRIGELLHESWMQKRSLSSNTSSPQIDTIYNSARNAGAIGGKILGAGGGGFILFVCRPQDRPAVERALTGLTLVPLEIDHNGTHVVYAE